MKKLDVWNEIKYNDLLDELKGMEDLEYKAFHSNLGINSDYLIGIRMPNLKRLAKDISKTDYKSFIEINKHNTYEEIILHGLILGYMKESFKDTQDLFKEFIKHIDNWALCDTTVANMHIWRKNLYNGYSFVRDCLNDENIWAQRVGFVLLLDYYICDEYIDTILDICNKFETDEYYVKMAIAWLISMCYIRYPEKTFQFLKSNKMSPWIQNKSIQKIRESLRVKQTDKEKLLKYKK